MKILFLDIDGVLNSKAYYMERGAPTQHRSMFDRNRDELDIKAILLLKDFVENHSIQIVLSSTWRILYNKTEMKEIFSCVGWKDMPLIDYTIDSARGHRGSEVETWLQNNEPTKTYAILDDDGDFFDYQPLVQTNWETGLLKEHIDKLEGIYQGD